MRTIRLTENDLHLIVEETIRQILTEENGIKDTIERDDAVVAKENTLGFVTHIYDHPDGTKSYSIIVCAVDYMKGGDPLLIDRETLYSDKEVRKARPGDDKTFNVNLF